MDNALTTLRNLFSTKASRLAKLDARAARRRELRLAVEGALFSLRFA